MTASDPLGEKVRIASATDVAREFHLLAARFEQAAEWVAKGHQRTNEAVALTNLLRAFAGYLKVAGDNVETHISILAMATRNLYELNLRVRDLVQSGEAVRIWNSEAVTDKIQVLEGILALDTAGDTTGQQAILQSEIGRLSSLRTKHGLPDVTPEAAGNVARRLGLAVEHKALFKLLSKLVHPSSYLVNDYENAASDEIWKILQIHVQLYAWDALERVCDKLMMPGVIRERIRALDQ